MFYSTRNDKLRISASEAIIKGISEDGGLFLPENIVKVPYESLIDKDYIGVAYPILKAYLDDFSSEEISMALNLAYSSSNFQEKIAAITDFEECSFLELFHGQTLTFKDMALSLLPHLMELSLKKHPEEKGLHILTATSGDTGSAVLSSFSSCPDISVSVLYPDNGVSYIQEKQMLSFTGPKTRAYALKDGNFDDCQTLVKKIMIEDHEKNFSSANSINIGRLLPQIIYYYYAYLQLVKKGQIKLGEEIDAVVPTGNFGDIFAGYLAKRMSLPIHRLVVASNANRVLTDFMQSGVYDARRNFQKTNSPSMDILISSNLERLIYLEYLDSSKVADLMAELKEKGQFKVEKSVLDNLQNDFAAYSADEKETLQAIKDCYDEHNYLLDPHTAVGYSALRKYEKQNGKVNKALVIATASPLKFPMTVAEALRIKAQGEMDAFEKVVLKTGIKVPQALKKAFMTKSEKFCLSKEDFVLEANEGLAYDVVSKATTANLGPGFDICGLCFKGIYNEFSFLRSAKDELLGFQGEEELNDNLVLKSYRRFFEFYALPYQPVQICQLKQGIPLSRGLGSSASCIIAGLIGANLICHNFLPKEDLLDLACQIEGHPDNVASCLLGGFIASYRKDDGKLVPIAYPVSRKLGFLICVPEEELSTSLARSILPKEYPLKDVTFDASHLVHLPKALKDGDLDLLNDVLSDRLHVPYRLPLIKNGEKIKQICQEFQLPFTISGAGSSLLVIYKKGEKKFDEALKKMKEVTPSNWVFYKAEVDVSGAEIKEVKI